MTLRGHVDVGLTGAIVVIGLSIAFVDAANRVWGWPAFTDWPWYAEVGAVVGALVVLVVGAGWEQRRRWPRVD